MTNLNANIFEYNVIPKYNRENIAKDFLFQKQDTRGWFLTENHLKRYLAEYLKNIPSCIFEAIKREGWSIHFTGENLEEMYGYSFEVYGLTDYENKKIVIYSHEYAIQYALYHEIGHFLDKFLGNVSNMKEWKEIFDLHQEVRGLSPYYFSDKDMPDEYFANCFLLYINEKELLKKCNGKAYFLMEKIVENLDDIVELLK